MLDVYFVVAGELVVAVVDGSSDGGREEELGSAQEDEDLEGSEGCHGEEHSPPRVFVVHPDDALAKGVAHNRHRLRPHNQPQGGEARHWMLVGG